MNIKVAAFYKFLDIDENILVEEKAKIEEELLNLNILGTILLAKEGINGTISGIDTSIDIFSDFLEKETIFKNLEIKFSYTNKNPFQKCKVKIKKEILTFNEPDCLPHKKTGVHLNPDEWNDLIQQKETILIDVRNSYEIERGTFDGAKNPQTTNFTEFKEFVTKEMASEKNKNIAMFCTGGIRCEKASSFMLNQGFENVFQLNGGILKYLEEKKEEDGSLWKGSCFIFDERRELSKDLKPINNVE